MTNSEISLSFAYPLTKLGDYVQKQYSLIKVPSVIKGVASFFVLPTNIFSESAETSRTPDFFLSKKEMEYAYFVLMNQEK